MIDIRSDDWLREEADEVLSQIQKCEGVSAKTRLEIFYALSRVRRETLNAAITELGKWSGADDLTPDMLLRRVQKEIGGIDLNQNG